MNGHFANVGDKSTKEQFGHGVQVISEDQEFKYANSSPLPLMISLTTLFKSCAFEIPVT